MHETITQTNQNEITFDQSSAANPRAVVSDAVFSSCLDQLTTKVSNPAIGFFGPQSVNWKVNRESIIFLGAARAALLQTAHPFVAQAIVSQSDVLNNPIGRFHRTFRMMFSMVFGSREQALQRARMLRRIHNKIFGPITETVGPFSEGTLYHANDIETMVWVHATLIDTAIKMYELVFPELTQIEKEEYYQGCSVLAAMFGLQPSDLPENWSKFTEYFENMCNSPTLTIGRAGHEISNFLIYGRQQTGKRTFVALPFAYRALTAGFMPDRLRTLIGLDYGERERKAASRMLYWLRVIYHKLPDRLRYVPPYHEAQARILGKPDPGLVVKGLNRLWIGQSKLVS